MSHYSDIGFKTDKKEDIGALIKSFFEEKYAKMMNWDIQNSQESQQLLMQKIGGIRLFAKVDEKNI